MTAQQTFRNTLIIVLTLLGVYAAYMSIHILIVLLIAIIIASAIRPAVLWLSKHHLPSGLAILIVYLALGLSLVGLVVAVVPPVTNQLSQYINDDQSLANQLIKGQTWLEQTIQSITGNPVKLFDPGEIRQTVSATVTQVIAAFPSLAGAFGNLLTDVILVVVIGVYWLTARDQAVDFTLHLFPLGWRSHTEEIIREIETSMGAYISGVVLVATFVGIANFALLSLVHVPNAVTLAFIVGVTTMIPIIGGYIGAGTATLLALLSSPIYAVFAFGSFVAVQQIENHYLTPRVMSHSVGLNPILIIVFLFVGSALDGVVGALIAVPVAGALTILLRHLVIEPRKEVAAPQLIEGGILLVTSIDRRTDQSIQPSAKSS